MDLESNKKFKLELEVATGSNSSPIQLLTFYFSNLKLLRQGRERKEQQYFSILDERKYILNEQGVYEPFVVFGKSIIKLSELKAAAEFLELKEKEKGNYYLPTISNKIHKTWK